jgi:predicted Zn-dependent protease
VRQVDLGFDPIGFGPAGASRLRVTFARSAEMGADLLGFVFLKRAGMRLLFGNADFFQNIEDRLALDFQLSG